MNFSRKTILVVGAALLAACGDKVTVQEYTPPVNTPKVNFVEVTPATATVSTGQSITFTAAVNADAGLATTVTWSASAGTVTSAGVFTAPSTGNPGISVCATSTVDTGKKGCATVVVTAAPAAIPASVSIASITAAGNLNAPVNPAAVAGQIDVRLNVNPGNQTVSKIVLVVGGIRTDSQTFTAAQSAALRYAADEAIAAQTTFPQVIFSVNTARFNATTGIPTWLNGPQAVSAQLYTTQGGTATAATATAQTSLTFANADGWVATVATSGTATTALNAASFRYDRGGLAISVLPVSYTGATVAAGTVTFGSACDASGIGARTTALVAPAAGTSAWTAAFSATAAAAATNVNGYEFDAGLCALNAIGETPTVTAVNGAGDALFAAAAPINAGAITGLRLDNRGPLLPTLIQNPNLRANGWINGSVALTSVNNLTATSNGVMIAPANQGGCSLPARLDCGVSTTARFVRIAASAAGTIAEARAATPTSTPTLPAPSATNLTYCGVWTYQDALGNEAALPVATTVCSAPAAAASTALAANHMLFGVDIAAPTIAYTAASIAANARRSGGTIGGEFIVTVNDTGLVGNSGMLPTSPVLMLVAQRVIGAPNSAGTINNLFANGAANAAGTQSATGVAAAAPLYSTAITGLTGAANHAYYTHSSTAFDAAGNSATVASRTMVYDNAAPVPAAPSTAVNLTATGYTANAFISEDLDIQDFSFGVSYGALAPFTSALAQLQMPLVAVNGFNAATFANTTYGVNAAVPMPLALQANVAAAPVTNMVGLYTFARAQSNLGAQSGNFAPTTVTPGTAISVVNFTTFPAVTGAPAAAIGGGAGTGITTGNATASNTTTLPANVTLTATLTGTTAVFNNPFSRIDFYMKDATGTRYFNVGSATVATLNDNGAVRTFTFTTSINGATVYALLGGAGATFASDIVAVGIGAANSNIGMVAAGATAINVVF